MSDLESRFKRAMNKGFKDDAKMGSKQKTPSESSKARSKIASKTKANFKRGGVGGEISGPKMK